MTREERLKIDAINEFKSICRFVKNHGILVVHETRILEALQRCQAIDSKFANATNTDWVKEGFTDAEVKDICDDARKALQTDQLKESPENFNKDSATESMLNADLISRQAAIDEIKERFNAARNWYKEIQNNNGDEIMLARAETTLIDFTECSLMLKKLPSVNPQRVGKWIPVSERLPEHEGNFLVTLCPGNDWVNWVDIAYFSLNNKKFYKTSPKVVAWMPLPESWKEDEE